MIQGEAILESPSVTYRTTMSPIGFHPSVRLTHLSDRHPSVRPSVSLSPICPITVCHLGENTLRLDTIDIDAITFS